MDDTATPCLNCNVALMPAQRFCGACGQRSGRARLTMHDISHDFLHAMFHVDQSIFALIKALAYRPGHVAREYVDGKRKKYFGPLGFLVLTVGMASFLILVTGVQWVTSDVANGPVKFLQQHVNLVILMQLPLLAATCALLFWNQRLHYAEHLILVAYTSGFRILLLALVALPMVLLAKVPFSGVGFMSTYLGFWLAYFAFAAAQFYRGGTFWVVVRAAMAALLAQALTIALLNVFIVLFISLTTH
jgi:hypothetical protein